MTAQVIPLTDRPIDFEPLLEAIDEMHALITLDPVLGVSPVRAYFVVNPAAKARIAASSEDGTGRRVPHAYGLVAYDFPFAFHQLRATKSRFSGEQAKTVIQRSAGLQSIALAEAAKASGFGAQVVAGFDADELKAVFFPDTQETVIQVFRLDLQRAGQAVSTAPSGAAGRRAVDLA